MTYLSPKANNMVPVWFTCFCDSVSSNTLSFIGIGYHSSQGSESVSTYTLDSDMYIQAIRGRPTANTKDGATVLAFRDDVSSVITTSVPAASTTATVTTGNVFVASGSEVCFSKDATASTTGNITFGVLVYALVPLK